MTLVEQIRAGATTKRGADELLMAAGDALLAANELARAVDDQRNMVCQDFGLQQRADEAVDTALAAYRRAIAGGEA